MSTTQHTNNMTLVLIVGSILHTLIPDQVCNLTVVVSLLACSLHIRVHRLSHSLVKSLDWATCEHTRSNRSELLLETTKSPGQTQESCQTNTEMTGSQSDRCR